MLVFILSSRLDNEELCTWKSSKTSLFNNIREFFLVLYVQRASCTRSCDDGYYLHFDECTT